MTKRKRVNAIFNYHPNVSQLLTDASTFYNTLGTAPASGYVTIASSALVAAKNRIAAAQLAEIAVGTGAIGLAAARDLALSAVIADVRNFVLLVQMAVEHTLDVPTAKRIVTACGLVTKKDRSNSKESFSVSNDDKSTGVLDINFKAAANGAHACYELQQSIDNIDWIAVKNSPSSQYKYVHGLELGTRVYFKGRMILSDNKGGAQEWMIPSNKYIIVS